MADLLLYPLCKAGYDPAYRPMMVLKEKGRLFEALLSEEMRHTCGTKYSCFDNVIRMHDAA